MDIISTEHGIKARQAERDVIQEHVDAFLKAGGEIQFQEDPVNFCSN